MVNPACETCKPDAKGEPLVETAAPGCSSMYSRLTVCMEREAGVIAACRVEWDSFRKCYHEEKEKERLKGAVVQA